MVISSSNETLSKTVIAVHTFVKLAMGSAVFGLLPSNNLPVFASITTYEDEASASLIFHKRKSNKNISDLLKMNHAPHSIISILQTFLEISS